MDSSNIASSGTLPLMSEDKPLLKHRPAPLEVAKFSINRAEKSSEKHQRARPTVTSRVIITDATQFRSVVQRLTGLSAEVTDVGVSPSLNRYIGKEITAYEDMLRCMKSLKKAEFSAISSPECLDCLVYCSLFPKDYVIDQYTIIQLWMAEGLVTEEPMEDIAATYLKALSEQGEFVSFLREDYGTGKLWYKVNEFTLPKQTLKMSTISHLRVVSDDPASVLSVTREPRHVTFKDLPTHSLQALARFSEIRTFSLLKGHKSNIKCVPYDFCISLQHLRILNLSRTKLSELPSSIGSASCLRFLDLSETLIRRLPETIDCLQSLQTLKLQNCARLVALPKATTRLTNLRHLDLGALNPLHSLPPGIGALTCLHTLSEFLVGKQNGFRIEELKNMNELSGKFCLSRLENVTVRDDAKDANLCGKQKLKKLELRWTDEIDQEDIGINVKTFERLRPHADLQDLRILCYGGPAFPSWISHPSFIKMASITLFKCENCQLLPSLGQLPSLKSLSLIELTRVRVIDIRFCREQPMAEDDKQFVAFPMLQKLQIKSMLDLEEWRDMGRNSFPRLTKLNIKDCPKLAGFLKLSDIVALEYLEINHCEKLPYLPYRDLPASIKTLVIEGCPALSSSFSIDDFQDWHKAQNSPKLLIYQRA